MQVFRKAVIVFTTSPSLVLIQYDVLFTSKECLVVRIIALGQTYKSATVVLQFIQLTKFKSNNLKHNLTH